MNKTVLIININHIFTVEKSGKIIQNILIKIIIDDYMLYMYVKLFSRINELIEEFTDLLVSFYS